MAIEDVSVVLAHGAWADGSSWAGVIAALKEEAVKVSAAPLPLLHAVVVSPAQGDRVVESGCVVKRSTRGAFRWRESKLRSGQRFLFKASKIKRLLTRIAKAERVTIKPTVKRVLFASAPRA